MNAQLANLIARREAMTQAYEAEKGAAYFEPPPRRRLPRQSRIAEAKTGALWVAELKPEQREQARIADDWKAQALADLDVFGGVPPAPERKPGRPKKQPDAIPIPADLVRELPGDAEVYVSATQPTMPAPRMQRQAAQESGPVVQTAERPSLERDVAGSIPAGPTAAEPRNSARTATPRRSVDASDASREGLSSGGRQFRRCPTPPNRLRPVPSTAGIFSVGPRRAPRWARAWLPPVRAGPA